MTAVGGLLIGVVALWGAIESRLARRSVHANAEVAKVERAALATGLEEVKVAANGSIIEAGLAGEERGRLAEIARREAKETG